MTIQKRMKVESLEAMKNEVQRSVEKELHMTREHEKQRKMDQEKIQQLEMLVVDRIEAFKKASKEHEMDKEELKKSILEKEQKISEMEALENRNRVLEIFNQLPNYSFKELRIYEC